jgi:hypothetical protein
MGWRSWVSVVGSSEHQRRPHGGAVPGSVVAVSGRLVLGTWAVVRGAVVGLTEVASASL